MTQVQDLIALDIFEVGRSTAVLVTIEGEAGEAMAVGIPDLNIGDDPVAVRGGLTAG